MANEKKVKKEESINPIGIGAYELKIYSANPNVATDEDISRLGYQVLTTGPVASREIDLEEFLKEDVTGEAYWATILEMKNYVRVRLQADAIGEQP